MNFHLPALRWSLLPAKIRGMFNLNDPRWGRDDDKASQDPGAKPTNDVPPPGPKPDAWQQPPGRGPQQAQNGPPDLDELWRDFNQKLGRSLAAKVSPIVPRVPEGLAAQEEGPRYRHSSGTWALASFWAVHWWYGWPLAFSLSKKVNRQ